MNRQGAELSLNMVIVAVILLLVAVLVIYIVSTGTNPFALFAAGCEEKGGECKDAPCSEYGMQTLPYGDHCSEHGGGSYCCYRPISGE